MGEQAQSYVLEYGLTGETLKDLRTLCYGEKTAKTFGAILKVLQNEWNPDVQCLGIEYCEEHLQSWPDEARFYRLVPTYDYWLMFAKPWMCLVRSVGIIGVRAENLDDFFAREFWSFIKVVCFDDCIENQEVYRAFFRSNCFKDLERAVIGNGRGRNFNSKTLKRVDKCSFLSRLKSLHLRQTGVGIGRFFENGKLNGLESLCLEGNCFGIDGVEDFLEESADRTKLKCLDLSSFSVDAREIEVLCADESLMTGLEVLRLSRNAIGSRGLTHIANCPFSGSLRELSLSRCGIGSGGIEKLVESGHLRSLCKLYLNNNILGDEGAVLIANSEWMKRLELLFLKGNRITDVGGRALMNSPYLSDNVKHQLIGQRVISVKVFEEWSSSVEVEDLQSDVASEVDGSLEG